MTSSASLRLGSRGGVLTFSRKQGKESLISKGREWKEDVSNVYPAHSVPDALNVMGLFILNRFRDITREEVIAMLNFDLMDTVAGRQIYDEGMEKGILIMPVNC